MLTPISHTKHFLLCIALLYIITLLYLSYKPLTYYNTFKSHLNRFIINQRINSFVSSLLVSLVHLNSELCPPRGHRERVSRVHPDASEGHQSVLQAALVKLGVAKGKARFKF